MNNNNAFMAALGSECSSGCESGWTLYLQENNASSSSHSHSHRDNGVDNQEFYGQQEYGEDDASDEEDLSMVSDASSGPPHHIDEPNALDQKLATRSKKRQKLKENLQDPSFLDDTASSPLCHFSMNNVTVTNQQTSAESVLDYSQGFSATYFEERTSLQDHFGFLKPSLSENEVHKNKWYGRKEMEMI